MGSSNKQVYQRPSTAEGNHQGEACRLGMGCGWDRLEGPVQERTELRSPRSLPLRNRLNPSSISFPSSSVPRPSRISISSVRWWWPGVWGGCPCREFEPQGAQGTPAVGSFPGEDWTSSGINPRSHTLRITRGRFLGLEKGVTHTQRGPPELTLGHWTRVGGIM